MSMFKRDIEIELISLRDRVNKLEKRLDKDYPNKLLETEAFGYYEGVLNRKEKKSD